MKELHGFLKKIKVMNVGVKFLISGDERRKLKKKLSLAKAYDRMFWFYQDVDSVYGGGLSDEEALERKKELENEIECMQKQLKQQLN